MLNIKSTSLSRTLAIAAIAAFTSSSPLTAQIRYELIVPEIAGTPIKKVSSFGNEINDNGESLLNRITTFAVWKDGAITHIANSNSEYPGSVSQVNASTINAFQQVVGSKTYRVQTESGPRSDTFPFYWDPANGLLDLDDLGSRSSVGIGNTRLFGINNQGVSLGVSEAYQPEQLSGNSAFTWSFESGRVDIPALSQHQGASVTSPAAINDTGIVVGTYRDFLGNFDSYVEQGFVYTEEQSSQDLKSFDSEFFSATHITARDVNNWSTLVGEQDNQAYLFNLETAEGQLIPSPISGQRSMRAYAINNSNIVAGALETSSNTGSQAQLTPFLWSEATGSVDLMPHIERTLSATLLEGTTPANTRITPKTINERGQISATLETDSTFSREIILQPSLNFKWTSMARTTVQGVSGVRYRYEKGSQGELIPAAALGYQIAFECSPDMNSWKDIGHDGSKIVHLETESFIELFVPFADCIFVRAKLVSSDS